MGKGEWAMEMCTEGVGTVVEFTQVSKNTLAGNCINWWQDQNCLSLDSREVPEADFPLEWHQEVKVGETFIHLPTNIY